MTIKNSLEPVPMHEAHTAGCDDPLAVEIALTDVYRQYQTAGKSQREAEFLKRQIPAMMQPIQPGDLLAGRVRYPLVGFSPEPMGIGYYCMEEPICEVLARHPFPPEERRRVEEMLAFWKKEATQEKITRAYPERVRQNLAAVSGTAWMTQGGIAFPLYRMAGITLDYEKLLKYGISGLALLVKKRAEQIAGGKGAAMLQGMCEALETMRWLCLEYARQAGSQGNADLASALEALTVRAPETFLEAMQLAWLFTVVSGTLNYGRMDVYLGPFLAGDLDDGRLTPDKAAGLLRSLWKLINAYGNVFNSRVFIGGKDRPNEEAADRFALLALDATLQEFASQPQLSLRFYKGQNPELMRKALDCLGEGLTFPILYNDDTNIPAVMAAFGVDEAEAGQYMPYGCGEYTISHAGTGTPNGVINLLKALEDTLHGGDGFATFENLWDAYAGRLEVSLEALACQEKIAYTVSGEEASFLLISLLFDDCVERGLGIFEGGARYLGGTVESYGNTNTADSLAAIRRVVFEDRVCSLKELVAACDANFAGYEPLRRRLLSAPKFGNDNEEVDAMAVRVHEHVCNAARALAPKVGLDTYLVVVINNEANTILGRNTLASADGRLCGEPMANAMNPAPGMDRNGVTAFLHSLVKMNPAIHAGTVQNMKFSRSMFNRQRARLEALLAGYFRSGGTQAMLTVVDRRDLEEAMREPEKWGHLMVRVGGFSARFVELSRGTQLEILHRTLNE